MTHRQAVRSALRMNEGMGVLFARLGSRRHPNGALWAAYVRALREMRDILYSGPGGSGSVGRPARANTNGSGSVRRPARAGQTPARAVAVTGVQAVQAAQVLRQLRLDVAMGVQPILEDAALLGAAQAAMQLSGYGINAPTTRPPGNEAAEGLQAVLALVDAQIAAGQALLASGARADDILGTDGQQGPLAPAGVLSTAWLWVGAATLGGWAWSAGLFGGRPEGWLKQAVAAIDERTTDCCLQVHGQVTALDGQFHTTGEPAFEEYQDAPPFHWSCRTATALVRPEDAGDALTAEMVDAARAERQAREETGQREVIHPASATSRRKR